MKKGAVVFLMKISKAFLFNNQLVIIKVIRIRAEK